MLRRAALALVLFAGFAHAATDITLEATGTRTYSTSVTSVELSVTSGASGRLMLPICFADDDSATVGQINFAETGYPEGSASAYSDNTTGTDSQAGTEGKISTGSEPANITCDSTSSSGKGGAVLEFSSVHADIFDTAAVQCGDAQDVTSWPPSDCSITTATDDAYVCYIWHKNGGGTGHGLASGWTEIIDGDDAAWTSNNDMGVACQDAGTAGTVTLTSGAVSIGGSNVADVGGMLIALKEAAGGPTFSSGPTLNSCNDTTCTFDVTPSENVTVYGATYPPAATAPVDCDAVQTGTGAIDTSSKSITGADTLVLDADLPRQDYYFCLENGSAEQSAVAEPTGANPVDRALTGYNDYVLTTLSATSWFAQPTDTAGDTTLGSPIITGLADTSDIPLNGRISASAGFADSVLYVQAKTASTITVDQDATSTQSNITVNGVIDGSGNWLFPTALATGDILEARNTSDIGGTVTCAVDFDCTYTPDSGEENDLAAILNNFEDVSDATDGLFTSPTNPVTVYINNFAPTCDIQAIAGAAFYGAVSEDLSSYCSHASITPTFETRAGDSYHTGLSLGGSTISGTITTEDENGNTTQIWACADDICELLSWTMYAVDTWTLTDCVGSTLETCLSDIETDAPWRVGGDPYALPGCNPSGTVASQSPVAATEVAPYATITLTMSDGATCALSGCNINAAIKNPIQEAIRAPVCSS